MQDDKRLTRRSLLRSAFIGGTGLAAASFVGCGDDDETGAGDTPSGPTPANGTPASTTTPPEGVTAAPTASMSAPRWELVPVSGLLPPARRDHSLVTDGQKLYAFGGRAGDGDFADLWEFDHTAGEWRELGAANAPPTRFGHNAEYLPDQQEIIVFGGQSGSGFLADIWTYSPANDAWTDRTPASSPSPRYGAAAAYGAGLGLWVSHGFTNSGRFDDTWLFIPTVRLWEDASAPDTRPEPRCLTRAVWDAAGERLVMFGGQSNSNPFLGDLWALFESEWTDITPAESPSPRNFYAMAATDPGHTLLFGGRAEDGEQNDLWLLDLSTDTWSQVTVVTDAPSPRSGHDCVWLPGERTLYVFGGEDDTGPSNELWRLSVPEPL